MTIGRPQRIFRIHLDEELSDRLRACSRERNTKPNDLLLQIVSHVLRDNLIAAVLDDGRMGRQT